MVQCQDWLYQWLQNPKKDNELVLHISQILHSGLPHVTDVVSDETLMIHTGELYSSFSNNFIIIFLNLKKCQ
jgi:hypothetical protein